MRVRSVVVAGAIVASSIFVPVVAQADTRICGNPVYAGMAVSTCSGQEKQTHWYPSFFGFGWVGKYIARSYHNSYLPDLAKVLNSDTGQQIRDSFNKMFP